MVTYPNLDHLKYFADAVELGSISAAAQRNLVTHPAISRAITALESHLNVQLLNHQKKSFQVTETGFKVAEQAKALLSAAAQFNSLSLSSSHEVTNRISVGISRTLASVYLSGVMRETLQSFPHANLQVHFGTTSGIVESVVRGTADIGITIGTQSMPSLKQTSIQSGKFVLIGPAGSSGRSDLSLVSKHFILTEPRHETEKLKRDFHRKFKRPLNSQCEVSSWDAIAQLVTDGFGIGLVPDVLLTEAKRKHIRPIPAAWFDCGYQVFIHHLKIQPINPVVRAAIRQLELRAK